MKFQVEINCLVSTIENTHEGNGKIPIDCSVGGRRRLKINQYAKLMGVFQPSQVGPFVRWQNTKADGNWPATIGQKRVRYVFSKYSNEELWRFRDDLPRGWAESQNADLVCRKDKDDDSDGWSTVLYKVPIIK
jgi:hypothetical protein